MHQVTDLALLEDVVGADLALLEEVVGADLVLLEDVVGWGLHKKGACVRFLWSVQMLNGSF